jgi:hypothetical protein
VLGVSLPPVGDELDERDPFATTRAIDGALRRFVGRDDVVAVRLLGRDPVAGRLVDELRRERLLAGRRGVRVTVVLHDDDERAALHGREVDPFVERARGGRAVADVDQADTRLVPHLEGQRHPRHDRNHVAERRDLTDEPTLCVAEVDVQFAPARRRVRLRHVLLEDLDRRRALHQHRPEIADER